MKIKQGDNAMRIQAMVFGSVILGILSLGTACGPKAFTKGEYDDPTEERLLDDRYNEADMQRMAQTIVDAMIECPVVKNAKKPPVVIVDRVVNKTEEHIDTTSLTDKIRTALIKSHKVRFVNKAQRQALEEEYQHSDSGYVSQETLKKRGKQIGADYLMDGRLVSNVQQVGNDKLIYYKLTMNLTNLDTSIIDCVEEKEIRKKYRKRSMGL